MWIQKNCLPFTRNLYVQLNCKRFSVKQLGNTLLQYHRSRETQRTPGFTWISIQDFDETALFNTEMVKSDEGKRAIVPSIRCQYFIYGVGASQKKRVRSRVRDEWKPEDYNCRICWKAVSGFVRVEFSRKMSINHYGCFFCG